MTALKRRKRLKPESDKRRAYRGLRRLAVEVALDAQDGTCWGIDHIPDHSCSGGLQGHEPLLRSRGGDPCDPDQILIICAGLHRQVHLNPKWATSVGLMRSA